MVIPREARRITYSSEIRKLKTKNLSTRQISFIEGSLLGDGSLVSSWAKENGNYRFMVSHSIKQQEYIEWKYEQLKPFVLTPPRLYKPTQALSFRTISHPEMTDMRKMFYKNGTKILPENIEEIISNPFSLAVWFMDDGNVVMRNGKLMGYHLNTQSFSYAENEQLRYLFEKLYDICPAIERNKSSYRLGIWRKASRAIFHSLIKDYILPSMKYKLG